MHARAPREEKVYENIIGRSFERISIVSRKVEGEFIVPICKVVQIATPNITTYNAKLEVTNNLIKLIKRNAFGFRNFENFKKKGFLSLLISKKKGHISSFLDLSFSSTHYS